jgi:hypothetical protein
MSLIGITNYDGALRTDNMPRAIPPAPNRFSFARFNNLTVINICAESPRDEISSSLLPG